jgi:hypothetical protein
MHEILSSQKLPQPQPGDAGAQIARILANPKAARRELSTPPTRTSVGVAALPFGATVEVEFEFYKQPCWITCVRRARLTRIRFS